MFLSTLKSVKNRVKLLSETSCSIEDLFSEASTFGWLTWPTAIPETLSDAAGLLRIDVSSSKNASARSGVGLVGLERAMELNTFALRDPRRCNHIV